MEDKILGKEALVTKRGGETKYFTNENSLGIPEQVDIESMVEGFKKAPAVGGANTLEKRLEKLERDVVDVKTSLNIKLK